MPQTPPPTSPSSPGTAVDPTASAQAAQPALHVERTGTRRYVGRSERGGVVELGGADVPGTFTPGELLKIALAGCTAFSSDAPLARRLGDDFESVVHVSGAKDADEERYPELVERLEVDLSGLDEESRERLLTVVRRAIDQACTVGRTLTSGATVSLSIDSVDQHD
ncbi:OsmC family protein [Sanguibacter suaedae]|uniref:OsmC family protein n=1 Tax=Sanguibacter suaedae TaxID=2795737 RepID=A0A934IB08_9MICO|nr:OsmC family protein [Sanguibacter suaedae]MBI9114638.1 OsmC family protein [Sanguibacter suaedae]